MSNRNQISAIDPGPAFFAGAVLVAGYAGAPAVRPVEYISLLNMTKS